MFCHLITYDFVTFQLLSDSRTADHFLLVCVTIFTSHQWHGLDPGHEGNLSQEPSENFLLPVVKSVSLHTNGINNVTVSLCRFITVKTCHILVC